MKKYKVEKAIMIPGGTVELTAEQARRRAAAVKATKKPGEYEVMLPVYFKVGEIIGLDAPSKTNGMNLTELKK